MTDACWRSSQQPERLGWHLRLYLKSRRGGTMHVFPAKPNRLVLWIVALLVTCYLADWSDDYYSFAVSEQYASFQSANGWRPQVSGGGHINPSGLMASFRTVSRDGEQLPDSTIDRKTTRLNSSH